ncbi:protein-L-isoaspartate O-methyltransferase [Catenuloplanes sp. NPDC051500]|uniref:protein-L-isoaspartate O-methyltransferase n=1 Tax=Catenuloplanes sp. NPDC051500 TaxID=3363959 RepID=UPI0037A09A4A
MAGIDRYVDELRAAGALTSAALADAFRAVPREIFLSSGFHGPGGRWVASGDPGFLDAVYRDTVLVTKVRDGVPVSSSSQPSLMATMLSALAVTPGMRVLEIGAGTGYNAALLAALGASVTSIDVQEDVAAAAGSALARCGVTAARVLLADGYDGAPDGAPYDRIIATAGVSGLSAAWADQLAPDGLIVAPVAHGGIQPVMTARRVAGEWRARAVCAAGFMTAAGALSARHAGSHPPPMVLPPEETGTGVAAPLDGPEDGDSVASDSGSRGGASAAEYQDVWFAAAAWDRRVTSAPALFRERLGGFALHEPGPPVSAAAFLPDGRIRVAGPAAERLAHDLAALAGRWRGCGSPPLSAWSVALALGGDAGRPIWAPAAFTLAS